MTVDVKKSTRVDMEDAVQEYYKHLIAPMDDMWEKGITGTGEEG